MLPIIKAIVFIFFTFLIQNNIPPASAEEGAGIKVETAPTKYRNIETIVEAVGTTKANKSVKIMAISEGIVRKITFADSQFVNENDVLLELDKEIERADLAESQAKLREAQRSLERSKSLRKRDAVAVSMVDKLESEVEIARAERERAARRLQDRIIKAPFSGRIGFSDIEIGSHIKEDQTIALLDDLSSIKVEFFLPETLYAEIHIGTFILAEAAAFENQIFKGKVEAIDTRVNADSRSFKVRAVIENEDGKLPAGMFLRLSLILEASDVLSIPEEAVIIDGAQNYVFAVSTEGTNSKSVKTSIKLGRRAFGWVEVLEGLNENQLVIIRGIQKVKDGSSLNILNESSTQVTQ
ncbi:MAG: efflux RND transporter periplasmic adaptor subunit [Terasakiella sp.]|uniref:efflux RND transporter periplasmic adaptor subunit n=1 Tax=unclassified Terasakiella TaxID=2614952 RepID=UPI003B00A5F1